MSKKIKKVTLESLAATMEVGFKGIDKRIDGVDKKVDNGFQRLEGKLDKGLKESKEDNESLARMVAEGFNSVTSSMATREDFSKLDKRIQTLEDGQEQIKLKLDNVAYNFELVEVQRRVTLLEKRVGIKR